MTCVRNLEVMGTHTHMYRYIKKKYYFKLRKNSIINGEVQYYFKFEMSVVMRFPQAEGVNQNERFIAG